MCSGNCRGRDPKHLRYEVALRIRDNTIVVQPFKIPLDIIRQSPGAYVKNASDWGGVNDKVMLVSRVYLDPAFRGWINHFMFRRVDESVRVLNNPEKFLDGVLRQEGVPIQIWTWTHFLWLMAASITRGRRV